MSLAGQSSRFKKAGYPIPKPFIEIDGIPMFQRSIMGMGFCGWHHLITLPEHSVMTATYAARFLKNYTIHVLPTNMPDVVHAILYISRYINLNDQLIIAVCDQIMEWDGSKFLDHCEKYDGVVTTFKDSLVDYSYAKVQTNIVTEIQEKVVISDNALGGIHYWKTAQDCFDSLSLMIQNQQKVNGAYYIAPSYNELIKNGKQISIYPIITPNHINVVGTPEGMREYELRLANLRATTKV
jgi:NDP-sugar pyrophosphorylase family protein